MSGRHPVLLAFDHEFKLAGQNIANLFTGVLERPAHRPLRRHLQQQALELAVLGKRSKNFGGAPIAFLGRLAGVTRAVVRPVDCADFFFFRVEQRSDVDVQRLAQPVQRSQRRHQQRIFDSRQQTFRAAGGSGKILQAQTLQSPQIADAGAHCGQALIRIVDFDSRHRRAARFHGLFCPRSPAFVPIKNRLRHSLASITEAPPLVQNASGSLIPARR